MSCFWISSFLADLCLRVMQEDGREQSSLNIKNSLWITGTKMDVLMSITEYL